MVVEYWTTKSSVLFFFPPIYVDWIHSDLSSRYCLFASLKTIEDMSKLVSREEGRSLCKPTECCWLQQGLGEQVFQQESKLFFPGTFSWVDDREEQFSMKADHSSTAVAAVTVTSLRQLLMFKSSRTNAGCLLLVGVHQVKLCSALNLLSKDSSIVETFGVGPGWGRSD